MAIEKKQPQKEDPKAKPAAGKGCGTKSSTPSKGGK